MLHHQQELVQYGKGRGYKVIYQQLCGIDEHGDIHNRNVKFCKAPLNLAHVNLFQLTVTTVFLLIDNASASSGDSRRRKGRSKDETRRIGTNHVYQIVRASNITADCTVCFAKSTLTQVSDQSTF